MSNIPINNLASYNFELVESITEEKQLNKNDSGKCFVITQGAYNVFLPKLSESIIGWHCKMVIKTAADTADVKIKHHSDDPTDQLVCVELEAGTKNRLADSINFAASSGADVTGSQIKVYCVDSRTASEVEGDASKAPRFHVFIYQQGDTFSNAAG